VKTFYAPDRKSWRRWLTKNHHKEPEIWLVYYKKSAGLPTIPYEDAVEEALCFGWIDSMERSLDENRYAGRFSPRRPDSNWSESNRSRVKRLIAMGEMTEAGMRVIPDDLQTNY
jgi:uncharacterized protein YdeI (YjbR/CyaY-like superfamily)